jgi:hypothetical protein
VTQTMRLRRPRANNRGALTLKIAKCRRHPANARECDITFGSIAAAPNRSDPPISIGV